ncbi:MAG: hypothetical protein QXH80_04635, partial [Candidatus Nanoarchaeia archaeon]
MPLNGDEHTINTTNRIATTEPGEPDIVINPGQPNQETHKPRYTLWYDFHPATNGSFEIDTVVTSGSKTAFTTILAAYTGDSLNNLSVIKTAKGTASDFDAVMLLNNLVAGQSYKIVASVAYDYYAPLLGPIGLRVRKVEPILNDNFADAIAVPTPQGNNFSTVTGKNRGATLEIGEPVWQDTWGNTCPNTVWWKWTADRTEEMQVNTIGSDFNTLLWVYTGNSVNNLTQRAFDNDGGGSFTSLCKFNATSGTTYYFRVGGFNAVSGNITLSLGKHRVPGDNFDDAFDVQPNFFFESYSNAGATLQAGEPNHGGTDEISRSIWFNFTPTSETAGKVAFSTIGSQYCVVAVYTGDQITNLTPVTSSVGQNATVTWNAVAGTTYRIAVCINAKEGFVFPYPYILTFQRVLNDNFANAINLSGNIVSVTSHNIGATKETNEPNHAGNSGGASVWFNWTPTTSGLYRISTLGSSTRRFHNVTYELDTLLAVYTGNAVNALTAITSNDDRGIGDKGDYYQLDVVSEVYFNANAGTTYRIAVDGNYNYYADIPLKRGKIQLEISPFTRPANDNFANAQVITANQIPFIKSSDLNNYGATTESGEPIHANNSTRSKYTLWYKFTAPESRLYHASTAGNLYDDFRAKNTVVAVYTGSVVNNLTPIASNYEALSLGHSLASFNATQGTTYYIAIGSEKPGGLSFMLVPTPPNDDHANAIQMWGSSFSAIGYNVGATRETGEADPYLIKWSSQERPGVRRSVWWKWVCPASGSYSIDTYFSDLNVYFSLHSEANGVSAWLENIINTPDDPLNYTVTGKRDFYDRRARATMGASYSLTGGQTYYFRIAGSTYYGDHAGTIRLDITGTLTAPPTPLSLAAQRINPTTVKLNWQDLSNDESQYVIERSLNGTDWNALATLPANSTEYFDNPAPQQTLYYR